MKPTIALTDGLPGSGKSTAARLWCESRRGRRVNLDDIRAMLGGGHSPERERLAQDALVEVVELAVRAGENVVVDNTHIERKLPNRLRHAFAGRVEWEVIDCTAASFGECVLRDATRQVGHVGEHVIRRMAARFEKVGHYLTGEWLSEVSVPEPYVCELELPRAVIVDVDGTLANHEGIRDPYDGDRCGEDECHEDIAQLVRDLAEVPYVIIVMSGREARHREATEAWLARNDIPWDHLYMRPAGDTRRDSIVKAELFDRFVRAEFDVAFVLDDRDQVVAMWRQMNLRCLQVAPGAF